ncbi:energy transducer TonB [Marinobacterium sp. CAU 1594]|nr:energy transducer TonB [Marinobacterium arenosum]
MQSAVSVWDRLGFTLFMAVALHAMVILGVSFSATPAPPPTKTLEITLAQYQSKQAPKEADFIAQANQQGSGTEDEKQRLATTEQAEFQAQQSQPLTAQQNAAETPVKQPQPPEPATRELSTQPERSPEKSSAGDKKVVTTVADSKRKQADQQHQDKAAAPPRSTGSATSLLARSLEIASLQAQIDHQQEWLAKRPKVRRLTSTATRFSEDAAYLDSWRRKIEMVGNLNYPDEARRHKTYGSLRLLVSILPDGSVKEIQVLKSSGHKVLDDAAVRIVRLAAPFQPFPVEMRKTTDVLEVIRTWKFEKRAQVY